MKSDLVAHYRQSFEGIAQKHQEVECWSARDLQPLLGYDEWRNFLQVIEKAMESCKNSKQEPKYHFVGVNKLIETGKGAERQVEDYLLTRYACYLIAQNGDPRKEVIAFAQSYFALQTRKQELIKKYHDPFHEEIDSTMAKAKFLIDCHSYLPVGPPLKIDAGKLRSDVCLGNMNYLLPRILRAARVLRFHQFSLPGQVHSRTALSSTPYSALPRTRCSD